MSRTLLRFLLIGPPSAALLMGVLSAMAIVPWIFPLFFPIGFLWWLWCSSTVPFLVNLISSPAEEDPTLASGSLPAYPTLRLYRKIRWSRLKRKVPLDLFQKFLALGHAAEPFQIRFAHSAPKNVNPLAAIVVYSRDKSPLSVWGAETYTGMDDNKKNWASIEKRANALYQNPRTRELVRALMDVFMDDRVALSWEFRLNATLGLLEEWMAKGEEETIGYRGQAWLAAHDPTHDSTDCLSATRPAASCALPSATLVTAVQSLQVDDVLHVVASRTSR